MRADTSRWSQRIDGIHDDGLFQVGGSILTLIAFLCVFGCIPEYDLTTSVEGQGTIVVDPSGGTYQEGTQVTVTANPAADWQFDRWEGAVSGSSNPITATMDADKSITAVFVKSRYTLTMNVQGQGQVSFDPSGGTYDAGTAVGLAATAESGWHFAEWEGDLTGSQNPADITMNSDRTIDAIFEPNQYALTITVRGRGSVEPNDGTHAFGTQVPLKATPSNGWRFVEWLGDVAGTDANSSLLVNGHKAAIAVFDTEELPFAPTVPSAAGLPDYPCDHQIVQDCEEDTTHWGTWAHPNATISLGKCGGVQGEGLEITYNLYGDESSVVAWYTFTSPLDLSQGQFVRFSYKGDPNTSPHHVDIKFKDTDDDEFIARLEHVAHVPSWVTQYLDHGMFQDQNLGVGDGVLNWGAIEAVLIGLGRAVSTSYPLNAVFQGVLCVDQISSADCAARVEPNAFEILSGDPNVAGAAANWIADQQDPNTGFVKSWAEEPNLAGHVYDESLALLVLLHQPDPNAAHELAQALISVQKTDGSWQRDIDIATGITSGDYWLGDMAWAVYALARYAAQFNDEPGARNAALKGAEYLRQQLKPADGEAKYVDDSTEINIDAWWAFQAVDDANSADAVKAYLLGPAWDQDQGRWLRGRIDPGIALDPQTWVSPLAVAIGQPQRALRALGFAVEALRSEDFDRTTIGLDGQGPFSVWYEGIAEYICARGPGAQWLLDSILNPTQRTDGSMPGSPDDWAGDGIWLTSWSGIAPTAWLYFANTRSPFAVGPFVTP